MEFGMEDCGWGLGGKVRVFEGRAGGLGRKRGKGIARRYLERYCRSTGIVKEDEWISLDIV